MTGSTANIQTKTQGSKSWPVVRLGDVAKTSSGGTPKRTSPSYYGGGIPWVKSGELGDSTVYETSETISEAGLKNSSAKIFPKGTLCVALYGATVGKLGILGMDAATNQAVCGIFLPPHIDIRFVYRFLEHKRRDLVDMAKGGAQPNISQDIIRNLQVPLPPLPDQRRIVAEIEQQFTRLDAGVAALRRTQANLKRYRAAVLKAACEGRLVPTEAELARAKPRVLGSIQSLKRGSTPRGGDGVQKVVSSDLTNPTGYETGESLLARILVTRRKIHEQSQSTAPRKKKYKEPISPTVPADEVLPDGWTWATWDQIAFSQNGRPFPSAEYQDTGVKLLRPGNLHVSGKVVWTESNTRCMPPRFADENPDLIVSDGELVMNLTAQSLKDEFLGRVCVTGDNERCLLNQRLARLTPIVISSRFVLIFLKGWRFRRYVDGLNSGSLIQHMFTSQLAEFTFGLPPLAEQTRIVAEVERRLSVVDELESVVTVNLQRATRLRQSILQKAFTGEI